MSDQPGNAVVRRGEARLRGVARNVQYRSENGAIQVLALPLAIAFLVFFAFVVYFIVRGGTSILGG